MTDVLGPADAGAINTLTTTGDVSHPTSGDTWFKDCSGGDPATGSNLPSKFLNRLLQQARRVIRFSGIPLANADDDMLGQAIQSGAMNWAGTFGGSANALTATLTPAAPALIAGLRVAGVAAATNTGPATFNVNGLGGVAIKLPTYDALTGGEIVIGAVQSLLCDGTAFIILSSGGAFVPIIPVLDWYVDPVAGTDSPTKGRSSGAGAFATLSYAISIINNYQSVNQVTVHVASGTITVPAHGNAGLIYPSQIASWRIIGAGAGFSFIDASALGAGGIAVRGASVAISGFTITAYLSCVSSQSGAQVYVWDCNCVLTQAGASTAYLAAAGVMYVAQVNGTNVTVVSGTGVSVFQAAQAGTIGIGYHDVNQTDAVDITYSGLTVSVGIVSAFSGGQVQWDHTEITQHGTATGRGYYLNRGGGVDGNGSASADLNAHATVAGFVDAATFAWIA